VEALSLHMMRLMEHATLFVMQADQLLTIPVVGVLVDLKGINNNSAINQFSNQIIL